MTLKKFFVILLSVLTAACVLSLIACDNGKSGDSYEEEYTITYVLDGGTLPDDVIKKYKKPDANITLPKPQKRGYDFVGWKDSDGNFVTSLAAGTTGNKTFTAVWMEVVYNIYYDLSGGTQATTGVITSYTISTTETALPKPTKTGYNFGGWKNNGGDPIFSIAADDTGDKFLTASWDAKSYTIKFNYGAGAGGEQSRTVYYDEDVDTLPTATPNDESYSFVGWKKSDNTYFSTGTKYQIDADLELYADYIQTKFTIKYDLKGGKDWDEEIITYYEESSEDIVLPVPKKTGYNFKGWKEDINAPIFELKAGTTGNKSFVAVWSAKSYTITFNCGNGAENVPSRTVHYGDIVSDLPDPTSIPDGYSFLGWMKEDNTFFSNKTKYEIDGNLNLTAKYIEKVLYTLIFDNTTTEASEYNFTAWATGEQNREAREITNFESGNNITPPKMIWDDYPQAQKENGYSITWFYYDDNNNKVDVDLSNFYVKNVSGTTITLYVKIISNWTPNY